jgi:hypothetical protein
LWQTFGIFVLFLPARAPELNPTKLIFRLLVKRLKKFPLHLIRGVQQHAVAHVANEVLKGVTHRDVESAYKECHYL